MEITHLDKATKKLLDNDPEQLWRLFRWKDGVVHCPYCGESTKQYKGKSGDGRYKCGHCNKSYSLLVGTAFQGCKLGIRTILNGLFFLLTVRFVSAVVLSQHLAVSYNTALLFLKRVQMAVDQDIKLSIQVAIDEVYMGGKWRYLHFDKKLEFLQKSDIIPKDQTHFNASEGAQGWSRYARPVFGGNDGEHIFLQQMGCNFDSSDVKRLFAQFTENVRLTVSDDSALYNDWFTAHETNDHSKKKYKTENGNSSNPIEGTFAHLRRWFNAAHIHCLVKYLQLYLNWFVFRWNHRKDEFRDMFADLVGRICRKVIRTKDILTYDALKFYKEREEKCEKARMEEAAKILKNNELIESVTIDGHIYKQEVFTLLPTAE